MRTKVIQVKDNNFRTNLLLPEATAQECSGINLQTLPISGHDQRVFQ